MSITSQLPPISLAQASAGLRALAQAAGQTVEARVLSLNVNGTTQVQIGRQVMSLTLPERQPVGATLTLSVQQSDGQLRLALVSVRLPDLPSIPQPQNLAPATSVQLSAAALASSASAPSVNPAPAANGAPPPPVSGQTVTSGPTPAGQVAASVDAPPGVSSASPANPAPLPAASAVPTASTRPGAAPAVPVTGAGAPAVAPATTGQTGTNIQAQANVGSPSAAAAAPTPIPAAPSPSVPAGAAPGLVMVEGAAARPGIPYAVAAPATVPLPTAGNRSTAAPTLPPVGQALSASMVGQHAASPNMGGGVISASVTPQAPVATAPATSPQAALAQMVQQALPRQDSILGLTRALTAIAGKVALPEPVAKAAQQVLAARLLLDGGKLGGAALKVAIQQSGVFQEAMLASGQAAGGELKGALLTLRQGLGAWLGNQAPVAQVGTVPPPIRGHVPRARAGEGAPPDMPDDPIEAGKVLLERTEAALSRLRLHQNASLPDPNPARQDAQWSMDLPVIVAGQNQILHLQIQRDAEQEAERSEERSWQVRFAINLAERGEVGAQISLRAKNTSVLLWADQVSTAQSLGVAVEELREELAGVGLVPGAIVVRAGVPAEEPVHPPGLGGHVVDATR
ncbi:flagellar hook-length control protein FliK [Devosia sediminis]|uniref:Flagellar hook-length control protein FliK n=1 Tax=Devosia sediminis TaxID=2798801 RepID=A0A934ITW1_9HYPH|nr:flagellar hook-length control protein FliK [Devosia sediminis]MBJ3784252.1 flagellar hook-length control protein FliK [Devosia sediminis]